MSAYSLSHLSDAVLLRNLAALAAQDRTTTAALLAHLAEVDARKLHRTPENADGLLAAAAHQSMAGIERLLAECFPRPDLPEQARELAGSVGSRGLGEPQLSPGTVESPEGGEHQLVPEPVESRGVLSAPGRIEAPVAPPRVTPLAPEQDAPGPLRGTR